jgi:hypothetical protein
MHAVVEEVPHDVIISLECDVLFDEGDAAGPAVRSGLGEDTDFHKREDVYVDAVPPGIPVLADGWRTAGAIVSSTSASATSWRGVSSRMISPSRSSPRVDSRTTSSSAR